MTNFLGKNITGIIITAATIVTSLVGLAVWVLSDPTSGIVAAGGSWCATMGIPTFALSQIQKRSGESLVIPKGEAVVVPTEKKMRKAA